MANISLFINQTYHQMNGGESRNYFDRVSMHLRGHEVVILISRKGQNILIIFDLSVTSDEKKILGSITYQDYLNMELENQVILGVSEKEK